MNNDTYIITREIKKFDWTALEIAIITLVCSAACFYVLLITKEEIIISIMISVGAITGLLGFMMASCGFKGDLVKQEETVTIKKKK